ncbi:MFS general substrate transporter [Melanogaster broomeanus]|nr:MFS general substrate transporter [Melanogaster broomeanus]
MQLSSKTASKTLPGESNPVVNPQLEKHEEGGSEELMACTVAPNFSPAQERKLWRRIDLRLLPMLTLMYLFSSMDRGNIGNAKLDGLTTQLSLTGNKYNIALVLWGLVMMLMGFVKTWVRRPWLTRADQRFAATLNWSALTHWYPRFMYQYRFALFCGSATLAGAFSGLLAFAINFMSGDGGFQGWSWIFIIEGLATIVVGFIAFFVMVDYPSTATFLTAEEREFVIHRQRQEAANNDEHHVARQVRAAFTDWQVWALSVVQISAMVPLYGITYFLPTIINNFGYSTSISQLLTIPPYAMATVVLFTFAYYSDKLRLRSPFVFAGQIIALIGFVINISDASTGAKYFGTHLCVIGSFAAPPATITWLANNLGGKYKRAVGMAVQIGVGNLGGAVACNIFRTQDSPRYILGHGLAIMFLGIGLVAVPLTVLTYKRINAQRDRAELQDPVQAISKASSHDADSEGKEREAEFVGDREAGFRYTI